MNYNPLKVDMQKSSKSHLTMMGGNTTDQAVNQKKENLEDELQDHLDTLCLDTDRQ